MLSLSVLVSLFAVARSQDCSNKCNRCLMQSDFAHGTFRVANPGKYCLGEDIAFEPTPDDPDRTEFDFDWFPADDTKFPACDTLTGGAFALGFFAAISIESSDVEIDLNNHDLSSSFGFYLNQRFFSLIEIGTAPYMQGFGPANFGPADVHENIYIHDGTLGLSSHHSIHSNEAHNVLIERVKCAHFGVGGIQFNGFSNVEINEVDIGPSSTDVQASGYFSNAKFLSLAMRRLMHKMRNSGEDPTEKKITFAGPRRTTLQEVNDNLLHGMRIAFRHFLGASTDADRASNLYFQSVSLFGNPSKLPDGSSLYGIIMNSKNAAVLGFGDSVNNRGDGEGLRIRNVHIHDLRQHANEVPAVYFDKCDNPDANSKTVIKGPFGDVVDLRHCASGKAASIIDGGQPVKDLAYKGNVLTDAQVALALYGRKYDLDYGTVQSHHFLKWALSEYDGISYDFLPTCTMFMCNGDIMLHTNKGLIGARFDAIEGTEIDGLTITDLSNESPISSYACGSYDGPHDGGSRGGVEMEGSMGTDVVAFSMYSGDVFFEGHNEISRIYSDYGSSMGMWFMADAVVDFAAHADMDMRAESILSGTLLTERTFRQLQADGKYPYPNNFFECNILLDRDVNDAVSLNPNPPNGVGQIRCKQAAVAAKLDPKGQDEIIEEAQQTSEINKQIDFEAIRNQRNSREKTPKTPRPTTLKTPKPTGPPKTRKPTKLKTPKPTKLKTLKPTSPPRTPRPTTPPKTRKPTPAKTDKPTKAPKTPKPTMLKTDKPTKAPKTSRPVRLNE